MKIYNDYMNDLCIIICYEFFNTMKPVIIHLISYCMFIISNWFYKYYYIPYRTDLNLKKVIITFDSDIIFSNIIYINYYHFKIYHNNRYIDIRGNSNYIIYNHNIFFKIKNNPLFKIYELPIKLYDQEDCCICYNDVGKLIGLCGHQSICSSCASQLNNCPICNNKIIKNSELLEKILYI